MTLNKESIDDYLYHCQNLHKTPSESFFKHTIFGLRAAYKVMDKTSIRVMLPKIKSQKDLPVVLSKSEVRQLIATPKYLKHRLVIAMLYGCGLRNYELCNLEQKDIDYERKTILIKKQKGKYDRYVPLNDHLSRGLKKYIATEHPHKWIFNSQVTEDGTPQPYTQRGVGWAVKEAKSKTGIQKKVTAHMLRHSYATHLLEDGLDIVSIKELLDHSHIETTQMPNCGIRRPYRPMQEL